MKRYTSNRVQVSRFGYVYQTRQEQNTAAVRSLCLAFDAAMKQIVVIGANGFVGHALSQTLSEIGNACIPVGRGDPLPKGYVDIVLDCNGEGRRFWANENPEDNYKRSVQSVEDRLAAIDCGVYVYLSTVDVYGSGRGDRRTSGEDAVIDTGSLDTYGRHKLMAEALVLEKAKRSFVLRCATLIGPGLRKNPVFDLLHDHPLRMTTDSTLSLLHTTTLGRAIQELLSTDSDGIFNVAASAPISIPALRQLIAEKRGIDPEAFPEHAEKISTHYDVNVDKISERIEMPTSEEALKMYLAEAANE